MSKLVIQQSIRLAPFTSWLVGGPAEFFCMPKSLDEIREAQAWATANSHPVTILGGGSNVLISDDGISGLTLCLKAFNEIQIQESKERLTITACSGVGKSELLKLFLKYKLAPALFLAGLPGDVGGGVVMNAGVAEAITPREFVEIVEWVEVLRPGGEVERIQSSLLQWSYRHCLGWQPGIVVKAQLSWQNQPDPNILEKVKQANLTRLSKQPLDMPSCGSVFINPPSHKAAQLIDQCGLKGVTIGGAQVSKKHANFIVNLGSATANDIWQLIQLVQREVKTKTQVELKTEVVRLGK